MHEVDALRPGTGAGEGDALPAPSGQKSYMRL